VTDTALKIIPDKQLRFAPPSIRAGGLSFTWPIGPEGFRRSGSATLGMHKFIGDNVVQANVIHFDESHIELSGTFPGLSSPNDMTTLIDVLTNRNKKVLHVPGVFPREQYVEVENYEFTHAAEDRTHSIDYSISFLKVGTGGGVGGFAKSDLGQLQGSSIKPASGARLRGIKTSGTQTLTGPAPITRPAKSQSARYFQVVDGVDTFRTISQMVYGDSDKAGILVNLNQETITRNNPGLQVNSYELVYHRWPRGTRIAY
jgi:hypothetical protein